MIKHLENFKKLPMSAPAVPRRKISIYVSDFRSKLARWIILANSQKFMIQLAQLKGLGLNLHKHGECHRFAFFFFFGFLIDVRI